MLVSVRIVDGIKTRYWCFERNRQNCVPKMHKHIARACRFIRAEWVPSARYSCEKQMPRVDGGLTFERLRRGALACLVMHLKRGNAVDFTLKRKSIPVYCAVILTQQLLSFRVLGAGMRSSFGVRITCAAARGVCRECAFHKIPKYPPFAPTFLHNTVMAAATTTTQRG